MAISKNFSIKKNRIVIIRVLRLTPEGLFLSRCSSLALQLALVSLVQAIDHLVGDIVSLVSIKQVITTLREDDAVFLILVVGCQVVSNAVVKSIVVLSLLCSKLIAQTLLQTLHVVALLLQTSLDSFGLLASKSVLLNLLAFQL